MGVFIADQIRERNVKPFSSLKAETSRTSSLTWKFLSQHSSSTGLLAFLELQLFLGPSIPSFAASSALDLRKMMIPANVFVVVVSVLCKLKNLDFFRLPFNFGVNKTAGL